MTDNEHANLKQTALYAQHLQLHATMIPFAGWQMPLHYGSQVKEHLAVRQHCGIFDISHMLCIDCKGEGSAAFLRTVLANDIAKCSVGKGLYTCLLNPQGGVLDDLIVYHLQENDFRCVVNAATRDKDIAWLQAQAKNFNVEIIPRFDLSILSIQGSDTVSHVPQLFDPQTSQAILDLKRFHVTQTTIGTIARTGYTGEDGFEIMLESAQALAWWQRAIDQGIPPIGLGARDTLRLEAGLNLYGDDMDETVTPYESNLGWTVDLKDPIRNFIGKDALLKQQQAGVKQQLVGIVLQDKGICRKGMNFYVNDQQGYLTSGGYSPSLNQSIGFARIPSGEFSQGFVDIRGKRMAANIVKLPFFTRS